MTKELTKLEKQLMIEDSVNFPHYCHNKSKFCIFLLINIFSKGTPLDNDNSGVKKGSKW